MASDDDDRLMARLRQGDLDALSRLVDRHQTTAIRTCARLVGDWHTGEELAQEGFLRLLHAAPEYQATGRFDAYFARILTHLAIDELRRRHQKRRLAARLGLDAPAAPEPVDPRAHAPLRRLEGEEDLVRLRQEMDRLAPDQRAALLLREWEGRTYAEIAERMDWSLERVKVTLHRARRRLLEAMSESGCEPAPQERTRAGAWIPKTV